MLTAFHTCWFKMKKSEGISNLNANSMQDVCVCVLVLCEYISLSPVGCEKYKKYLVVHGESHFLTTEMKKVPFAPQTLFTLLLRLSPIVWTSLFTLFDPL
jgi:hypothetical protein